MLKSKKVFLTSIIVSGIIFCIIAKMFNGNSGLISSGIGSTISLFDAIITWFFLQVLMTSSDNFKKIILSLAWVLKLGIIIVVFFMLSRIEFISAKWLALGLASLIIGGLSIAVSFNFEGK